MRVLGLSMTNWASGLVGAAYGSRDEISEAYNTLRSFCFVRSFNLLDLPKSKRICLLSKLNIGLECLEVDPYGIVNAVATKLSVSRSFVLPVLSRKFIDLIRSRYEYDSLECDEEVSNILGTSVRCGEACELSKIAASCPEVCREADEGFSCDGIRVRVKLINLRAELFQGTLREVERELQRR